MNTFSPKNDAETLMERFLWQDYTEGRQGHGRIDGAEYTGYRALLESEGGLYLVDIGRGEYDTYLSYQDIEALFNRKVSRDRIVKIHPSQLGTVEAKMTLEELGRRYETRSAVDAEGNPLQGSSSVRMQFLFRPMIDSRFHVEPTEPKDEKPVADEFKNKGAGQEKEEAYFQSELEQILGLIDEDERNGELTHSQAEEMREKARLGELILVDVGTGLFDTYLTLEEANELADRTAHSDNPDQTVRLYDASLLGDFGNPSGEVAIRELDEVFARRLARGAAPEPEEQAARPEETEKALQSKQEKDTEAAREEAERASVQGPRQGLTPPFAGPTDIPERGQGETSPLRPDQQELQVDGEAHEKLMMPKGLPQGPVLEPHQKGFTPHRFFEIPEKKSSHGEGMGPLPRVKAETTQPSTAPRSETRKTEAAPKPDQQPRFRGGPKRYEPSTRPKSKAGGSSAKRWALSGGASLSAAGGGAVGFTVLRRLGDAPDLALLWIDSLTQLFV